MCDDGEGAPAGAADSEPAAATEVVSPRGCEGDSSSSHAASRPNFPPLEVCNLAHEPCHNPAQQPGVQLAFHCS